MPPPQQQAEEEDTEVSPPALLPAVRTCRTLTSPPLFKQPGPPVSEPAFQQPGWRQPQSAPLQVCFALPRGL